MFCYLHFPTTNSPLRSSEPISYYIYFTSQPFRKYKKPPLCMHREEIFGYVQEAERYFLYYDTLLYKPISFFKQALRLLNRTYRTFLLSLRNSLFFLRSNSFSAYRHYSVPFDKSS